MGGCGSWGLPTLRREKRKMTFNSACMFSHRRSLGWTVVLFGTLFFLLTPRKAPAQQAQAAINGTVRDTSGAVVPDATIVLHNNGTNLDRTTTTNSVGAYALTEIQPGNYHLRVSKDGFRTSVQSSITL